jgi:ribosomal-protein-alanine N-acetyltransferase
MNDFISLPFHFRIMQHLDLEHVRTIESACHLHPWTMKNFVDCLQANYWNYVLCLDASPEQVIGHCIVMPGVNELHLLNISIMPEYQRHRIAYQALIAIEVMAKEHGHEKILLEVRASNVAALGLYGKLHYQMIGTRKNYYPSKIGSESHREDALVMEKALK